MLRSQFAKDDELFLTIISSHVVLAAFMVAYQWSCANRYFFALHPALESHRCVAS